MESLKSRQRVRNFIIFSILAGFLFPLVASYIEIREDKALFTAQNIIELHKTRKVFWIIDMLPIAITLIAISLGRVFGKYGDELYKTLKEENIKSGIVMQFADKLRKGDTDFDITNLSEDDLLGQALIDLRDSLKRSKAEEEARRKEDAQRHWVSEGLAKFSELLRHNQDNLENLSYDIISNLVKYSNATQGAFYIAQENEFQKKYFELTACIAYERKKYATNTFEWKEGLIGRCAQERLPIFLTDVPDNYLHITSGLGTANPRCILIVPLIVNEEVHGVVELASFTIYEKYQIEFVTKLAESIGSTLSSVKINIRTNILLKDSQVQAEKLAKQEEIMRKNMDELKSTQLEAAKQAEQFVSFTNSVNHTLIRSEYDINGILLYANLKFLQKMGYTSNQEVEGRHISMFINEKDMEWFNKIWTGLAKGGRHFENYMKHVTKDGKDLWTMATYSCVRGVDGKVEKILFLAIDTTQEKKQSLDYEGQIAALNRSNIKAEYTPFGIFINCNKKFEEVMGYTQAELRDKSVFYFFQKDDLKDFKSVWDIVISGVPYEGQFRKMTQDGEERWFQATYTAVHDMYGEIAKIIYIAHDITEQKMMEMKNLETTIKLKQQEETLKEYQQELEKKLEKAKEDVREHFKEIERMKTLNEMTLEGMLDAIISINQESHIIFFNKAAEELWQLKRESVIGKHLDTLISPTKNNIENYVGRFLKISANTETGVRREVFIVNNNGEDVSVLMTLSEARMEKNYTLTAFIQKIEVELF